MSTPPHPDRRVAAFEDLAFGLFVHWGLYSQLGRGEWIQHFEKIPAHQYLPLMDSFTAEDFDAVALAKMAKRSGMKYITLTSRHHEGFSLYDSRGLSKLDVTHTPCGRDLVKEFVQACRSEGIVPMLYHTTLDWNDPRFESDWHGYLAYLRDSVEVLCTNYGPIGGFWFDGNWSKPEADWQESELYAVIRKHQPDALIINNTGVDALGRTGHPEIDCVTFERSRPEPLNRAGAAKYVACEMCHTMNFHWGVAKNDFNLLSPAHVVEELCNARKVGANLLMNMGPESQGRIPNYESAAFEKVGDWVRLCGEAVYQGRPCQVTGTLGDFALRTPAALYLFVTGLTPTSDTQYHGVQHRGAGARVFSNVSQEVRSVSWLDNGENLAFKLDHDSRTLKIDATNYPYGVNTVVRVARVD